VVEVLVTMSIMAIGFVLMLGAISVFFSSTRVHRAGRPRRAMTYVEKLAMRRTRVRATST
jgi:Tfp pilus assembly protein PilW